MIIEFFDQFHLLRPWFSILFIPLLLLHWLRKRTHSRKNPWSQFVRADLLEAMLLKNDGSGGLAPAGLGLILSVLWVFTLTGPTWQQLPSQLNQPEKNILVLLELDESMLTNDMSPNRLVHAKLKLKSLLGSLKSSPVGLIAYAGTSHLILPFTKDQNVLNHYLDGLNPATMPIPGHNLLEVMAHAKAIIGSQNATIILMTDGDYEGDLADTSFSSKNILWLFGDDKHHSIIDRQAYIGAGFTLIESKVGTADIKEIQSKLQSNWLAVDVEGDQQWLDAGYYLVWPLIFMMLYWFRRGMVISWE